MTYYKSKTGVVHLGDCTRVGKARPWAWAEGHSDARIAMYMAEHGLMPCKLCQPPLWPTRANLRIIEKENM